MERKRFLQTILGFLGIYTATQLTACSTEEEGGEDIILEENNPPPSPQITDYNELKELTASNGLYRQGDMLYLDIQNETFAPLQNVEGFINSLDHYVLVLRTSDSTLKAFTNCCPHQGTINRWSYSNGEFTCGNHYNSYGTSSGNIAGCSAGQTSGNLRQFQASLDRDIITINLG